MVEFSAGLSYATRMNLRCTEIAGVLCSLLECKRRDVGNDNEQDTLPMDVVGPAARADFPLPREDRPSAESLTWLAYRPQEGRAERPCVFEDQLYRPAEDRVVAHDALRCPLRLQDFPEQWAREFRPARYGKKFFPC